MDLGSSFLFLQEQIKDIIINCTNQLVMHILIARLSNIVEKAGILEPGQSGGRQGRKKERIFRRN